ncbi:MAG: hypothetical protein AAF734_01340 [Bacteroidota bacterium]
MLHKKWTTLLLCCLLSSIVFAQNPYEALGEKEEVLTYSDGKYKEVFDADTLKDIGFFVYDRINKTIHFIKVAPTVPLTSTARFLSVDPLARDFAWNSVYAFAENDVIRSIDLEGLERYFSHDGKRLLGQIGSSNQMRVVKSEDLYNRTIRSKWGSDLNYYTNSVAFHESSDKAQVNITKTIYN